MVFVINSMAIYDVINLQSFLLQLIQRTDNELFSLNANSPCVTPLHYAAFHGHTDAMSLLINTVIDVDLRDPNG